jgi:hypothetical protein
MNIRLLILCSLKELFKLFLDDTLLSLETLVDHMKQRVEKEGGGK